MEPCRLLTGVLWGPQILLAVCYEMIDRQLGPRELFGTFKASCEGSCIIGTCHVAGGSVTETHSVLLLDLRNGGEAWLVYFRDRWEALGELDQRERMPA